MNRRLIVREIAVLVTLGMLLLGLVRFAGLSGHWAATAAAGLVAGSIGDAVHHRRKQRSSHATDITADAGWSHGKLS